MGFNIMNRVKSLVSTALGLGVDKMTPKETPPFTSVSKSDTDPKEEVVFPAAKPDSTSSVPASVSVETDSVTHADPIEAKEEQKRVSQDHKVETVPTPLPVPIEPMPEPSAQALPSATNEKSVVKESHRLCPGGCGNKTNEPFCQSCFLRRMQRADKHLCLRCGEPAKPLKMRRAGELYCSEDCYFHEYPEMGARLAAAPERDSQKPRCPSPGICACGNKTRKHPRGGFHRQCDTCYYGQPQEAATPGSPVCACCPERAMPLSRYCPNCDLRMRGFDPDAPQKPEVASSVQSGPSRIICASNLYGGCPKRATVEKVGDLCSECDEFHKRVESDPSSVSNADTTNGASTKTHRAKLPRRAMPQEGTLEYERMMEREAKVREESAKAREEGAKAHRIARRKLYDAVVERSLRCQNFSRPGYGIEGKGCGNQKNGTHLNCRLCYIAWRLTQGDSQEYLARVQTRPPIAPEPFGFEDVKAEIESEAAAKVKKEASKPIAKPAIKAAPKAEAVNSESSPIVVSDAMPTNIEELKADLNARFLATNETVFFKERILARYGGEENLDITITMPKQGTQVMITGDHADFGKFSVTVNDHRLAKPANHNGKANGKQSAA